MFLVLLLTSVVFCENTLTLSIKVDCCLYLNLYLKSLLYTQEMQGIILRLAIEILPLLYLIKDSGHW